MVKNTLPRLMSVAIAVATLALSACSTPADPTPSRGASTGTAPKGTGADRGILILGDSVAEQEGVALIASLGAAGVRVTNGAADGSSLTLVPDKTKEIEAAIDAVKPGIVIYQLGVMDFGSEGQQREAYETLAALVKKTYVQLLFVTSPPIKTIEGDKFQGSEKIAELTRLPKIAADIAHRNPANVKFLDATPLWGTEFKLTGSNSDKQIRADDGIHLCVTGAAVLAAWIPEQMATLYDDIAPAKPESWLNGSWTNDRKMEILAPRCTAKK